MNAEELYEAMKQALNFLGLRWGDMDAMQVSIRDKKLVFSYEGKEVAIPLPDNAPLIGAQHPNRADGYLAGNNLGEK